MNLTGIISISGKPGLFKVLTKGKNNVIVESIVDNKRFPVYASDRITALEDISIYTYEENVPLRDIFTSIYTKEEGKESLSHKADVKELQNYILEIIPNYDQERVYLSDIKKLFQWYNLLLKMGFVKLDLTVETEEEKKESKAAKAKKEVIKEDKPIIAKKQASKAKSDQPKIAKPAAPKKVASVKTGASRGK